MDIKKIISEQRKMDLDNCVHKVLETLSKDVLEDELNYMLSNIIYGLYGKKFIEGSGL